MRKRLVIGAIAVVVIAAAAYVYTPPRIRTVEYHKSQYLDFASRLANGHWTDMNIVPLLARDWYRQRWVRQRDFHERALLELGYLKQATVVVTNSVLLLECIPRDFKLKDRFSDDNVAFTTIRGPGRSERDGAVLVIAPTTKVEQIADVVREAYAATNE